MTYNRGARRRVQRAITKNQRAGLPTGYLDLNIPAETQGCIAGCRP